MTGGGVKAPQPTAEERELQRAQAEQLAEQTRILKAQQAQLTAILPFIAKQSGYEIELGLDGTIKSIKESTAPDAVKRRELESELLDRSLKALRGELPVDPQLETALDRQEEELRGRLAQQFGPGYETSTPGIETLAKFEETGEGLRSAARRDQLTLSEQLSMARSEEKQVNNASFQSTAFGQPQNFAQLFGNVAAGYGKAQQPFIANRQLQLQASIANQQSQASSMAGFGQLAGLIFSDEREKTDIRDLQDRDGEAVTLADIFPEVAAKAAGVPVKEYRFKRDKVVRTGVMAQDVERVMPEAVREHRGRKFIDMARLVAGGAE